MLRFGARNAMKAARFSAPQFIGANQLPRHLSRSVLPTATTKAFGSMVVSCDDTANIDTAASMESFSHELQQLMILLRGDSVAVSWTALGKAK
eukprot:TRINITY_DN3142_c0_g1_i2.p1 TRINITY_DN3142_c0_g1~~TRINITY_DN3142_c0_g1_i2.p1  ORF type:complete len:106 (+),score=14.24 TRINITY_DN3142_c0_g1_i2:42-320(+)